jgi:hypothetical protein
VLLLLFLLQLLLLSGVLQVILLLELTSATVLVKVAELLVYECCCSMHVDTSAAIDLNDQASAAVPVLRAELH